MPYISHARTLLELREEFCSDIHRRLDALQGQINLTSRSMAEQSRLACAKNELENLLYYWQNLDLPHAAKAKSNGPQ